MSTKNLARTVIEGGRTHRSSWLRRYSHQQYRVLERAVIHDVDGGGDADEIAFGRRRKVYKDFHDKLGPPRRWLQRRAGRPWAVVQSELLARFDPRTTPGRHIVFDHMLRWIGDPVWPWQMRDFAVDARGVLRSLPCRRPRRKRAPAPLPRPRDEIERWLDGRLVGARGDILYWFTRTPYGAYRQHRPLDARDAVFWGSLPTWFCRQHDAKHAADLLERTTAIRSRLQLPSR